jgi:uncharacterized protein (DUF1800 family)
MLAMRPESVTRRRRAMNPESPNPAKTWLPRLFSAAATAALSATLIACGSSSSPAPAPTPPPPPPAGITGNEAARFLTQASFGPTDADIARVQAIGYSAWIDEQFALAPALHLPYVQAQNTAMTAASFDHVSYTFWKQAITAPDQLRQRVKFALSQIVVISAADGAIANAPDGTANYLDRLGANAFGNYRTLLEDVSKNPMMGLYLSSLANQKTDPGTGRVPDENYAREIMQLFSIGLVELNADGALKTIGCRLPTCETYNNDDITGLAKVFTGWSWKANDTSDASFRGGGTVGNDRYIMPMQAYPQFHETLAKNFLGATILANTPAQASLTTALDTLFNHANLCPFVGRQLIQRMVTSNPSPAYVGRVSAACANNGSGVRGDMKAIVRAVLLDPDARDAAKLADPQWGKLREPVLRLSNWARCFSAASNSGDWRIRNTDNPGTSLGQQPLRAPSVFNFWRPGYVPPNTSIATANLVAPEFQITHETSIAGYTNALQVAVALGVGDIAGGVRDVLPNYTGDVAVAANATQLVDRVDRCTTFGTMGTTLRNDIIGAVNSIPTATQTDLLNRVYTAVMLTMASPEYLVQK